MAKLIDILQTKHELDVPNGLIKKLYDMITEKENHNGEGIFNDNSKLDGEITLANPTYKEWTDKINEVFPYLIIHTLYYLLFQDKKVETMMINHLLSKGVGDGIGITEENAKDILINSLPSMSNYRDIEYFNELPKFEKIKSIGGWAFADCNSLKEIDLSNINSIGEHLFNLCASLEKVTLGSLVSLPTATFTGCSKLKTVTGTANITSIGGNCFQDCERLESIDLSSVTTITGSQAFKGCKSLTSVNLENCTSIGNSAFLNCDYLESVGNTSSLTSVGWGAFRFDTSLETINLSNCTSLGEYAFDGCTNLRSVDLSNLTTAGRNCFSGCTNLNTVILGPNFKIMPIQMFADCGYIQNIDFHYIEDLKLSSVTVDLIQVSLSATSMYLWYVTANVGIEVPASVTSISQFAFVYTPYVKFYGTTPPTVGEFHNFDPGKIIVPRGYIDTYKNASTMWQRLADKTWEEFDP